MVYQYYIEEIQKYDDGSYGNISHFAYDEDADIARQKGEAKYYEVLSAAAVSALPQHSAILFYSDGTPIMHKCYTHKKKQEPEPEPEEVELSADDK